MANFSNTALLSQSDMQSILSAVKTYIDKQVELANGDTTAVANLLNALIGADDKAAALADQKTVRAISAEEVAKIVANADTKYDTLKEIADWILSDTTGAAKMASDILQLQNYVGVPAAGETAATGLFKALEDAEKTASEGINANKKAIEDEASRADAAEKANAKAVADEKTRAEGAEKGLSDRLDIIEGEGEGSVKKAQADAATDATTKVNALKNTAVSATHTDDGVTVTLGGTVGAPTVTVAVDMCTAEQLKDLTDMFAIGE